MADLGIFQGVAFFTLAPVAERVREGRLIFVKTLQNGANLAMFCQIKQQLMYLVFNTAANNISTSLVIDVENTIIDQNH